VSAVLRQWRVGPANEALDQAIARLCATDDVVHVAVMPDAHVADDVCVGTVTATIRHLLPAAVGSDIGCGIATLCLNIGRERLSTASVAARLLSAFARIVPPLTHPTRTAPPLPAELQEGLPSELQHLKQREGRVELGTLGRGNHFLELQRDEQDLLWLTVHSGSRCMGPAIRRYHEARANRGPGGLAWLDASDEQGQAYLKDAGWAARYAELNRAAILVVRAPYLRTCSAPHLILMK
jgi:tRNA-splicing ligase RtcB